MHQISRLLFPPLTLCGLLLLLPAGLQGGAAQPPPDRARAEFEAICADFRTGENQYFGHQILADLEQSLASNEDPLVALLVQTRLGYELLRVGRIEDSIDTLDQALKLLRPNPKKFSDQMLLGLMRLQALAYLQLAEDQNCLLNHAAASCILPIRPDAVHAEPGYAQQAGDLFLRMLELDPKNVASRWLLNLSRMLSGQYPAGVPERFRLPEEALGLATEPLWKEIGWQLDLGQDDLSGGAVMDDFDGDGLLDLISSSWDPCEPLKAYRNNGQGGFVDVSAAWGLDSQFGGLNLVQADYDGDGALDLLVLRGAWLGSEGRIRNSLLRNDLSGESTRFQDVTAAAGLAYPAYPTQNAGWADYDLDGDLDLFVGNESSTSSVNPQTLNAEKGFPFPSQLFRNNGDGTFADVARQAGVRNQRFSKGSTWGDYDDDGDPDLYISNIGPNRLYRNNGDGTFVDVAEELAVVEPAQVSFPTWFFDFDNDGDLDLFVARFSTPLPEVLGGMFGLPNPAGNPVLYLNEGGTFREISAEAGLDSALLVMGANYGDLDNDGFSDIYLGTGTPDMESLMPNIMYRNVAGRRFEDVTFETGFGHLQKGHAIAFGDLDNDGEQEVFQQLGGAFPFDTYGNALYENPGSENRWITLRLRGTKANRFGVGARIQVDLRAGESTWSVHKQVGSGGSFGASSLQQEIGLGLAEQIERIVIRWPGNPQLQIFENVILNRIYDAFEDRAELEPVELPRIRLGAAQSHPHRNTQ